MNLTELWSHAVELEWQGRQEAQSLPGWAVDDVLSSMPRCVPGSLRSVQLLLDQLVEMRDRAVCHQRRNGRRSHVPEWWDPLIWGMWRRGGVQKPIPGEPQWPIDVLWIPPLPRPPWKTDQWDRIQTSKVESQWCPVMRGWTGGSDYWQSQKRQTDPAEWGLMIWNRLLQFAGLQWQSSAVSVEWPLLKPDCLASSLLFCERNNETCLKTTHSSVLAMNGRREIGL